MRRLWLPCLLLAIATSCTESKSEEEKLTELVSSLPWMLEVMELCQGYDGIASDTEKKDVSSTALNLIRSSGVNNVRGTVARVLPVGNTKPPGEYSVQIKVGDKVEFASQSQKRPVKQGTPVFEAVSKLGAGDCVTFTAEDLDPIAEHQRGKVCEHRYYAQITQLGPCQ